MLDVGCSRSSVQGSKAHKVPFGGFSPRRRGGLTRPRLLVIGPIGNGGRRGRPVVGRTRSLGRLCRRNLGGLCRSGSRGVSHRRRLAGRVSAGWRGIGRGASRDVSRCRRNLPCLDRAGRGNCGTSRCHRVSHSGGNGRSIDGPAVNGRGINRGSVHRSSIYRSGVNGRISIITVTAIASRSANAYGYPPATAGETNAYTPTPTPSTAPAPATTATVTTATAAPVRPTIGGRTKQCYNRHHHDQESLHRLLRL
jgi:hypothetical protein